MGLRFLTDTSPKIYTQMIPIVCHWEDTNYSNNEISLHTYQKGQDPEHWQRDPGKDVPQQEPSALRRQGGAEPPLWKAVWKFLTELNVPLLNNPAITFLGIYPEKLKISIQSRARGWL